MQACVQACVQACASGHRVVARLLVQMHDRTSRRCVWACMGAAPGCIHACTCARAAWSFKTPHCRLAVRVACASSMLQLAFAACGVRCKHTHRVWCVCVYPWWCEFFWVAHCLRRGHWVTTTPPLLPIAAVCVASLFLFVMLEQNPTALWPPKTPWHRLADDAECARSVCACDTAGS